MEPRVSMITLGVADVHRSRTFYERLGWQGFEIKETVFFPAGGMVLTLWGRAKLADDAGLADVDPPGFSGIGLAHNVRSEREVDEIATAAAEAGATVTRPPATTFYGGYAAYFTDPDGHVWEVAYNPGFALAPDGSVTVPKPDGAS